MQFLAMWPLWAVHSWILALFQAAGEAASLTSSPAPVSCELSWAGPRLGRTHSCELCSNELTGVTIPSLFAISCNLTKGLTAPPHPQDLPTLQDRSHLQGMYTREGESWAHLRILPTALPCCTLLSDVGAELCRPRVCPSIRPH